MLRWGCTALRRQERATRGDGRLAKRVVVHLAVNTEKSQLDGMLSERECAVAGALLFVVVAGGVALPPLRHRPL